MAPEKPRTAWKLAELADEVGVSPRTVRYYVQRGLLPAPAFKGPDTVYGAEHLLRLRAIRKLQQQYLPLDAIQVELLRRSPEQLQELLNAPEVPPAPPGVRPLLPEAPVLTEYRPSDVRAGRWERWELAPGVELHVSDRADRRARELAERLRREAEEGLR
ncbi:MAG TPA: helix-turn-helix domain-containing protein [Myxococcales bacterium]|nr:helix-turn-helix domain-containing protein [Myxococcales bacterium]